MAYHHHHHFIITPTYLIACSLCQRCSSINCWSSPQCSHHRHSCQFPLALSFPANQVQTGGVIIYRALHGTEPQYLSDRLSCIVSETTSIVNLHQSTVRPSHSVTVGERSSAFAGPKLWSSLLDDITSASSSTVFQQKLKTRFGSHIRTLLCSLLVVVLAMVILAVIYFGHLKNCYVNVNVNHHRYRHHHHHHHHYSLIIDQYKPHLHHLGI